MDVMKTGGTVLFYCVVVAIFVFPGHAFLFRSSLCSLQCLGHGSREEEKIPQMKTGRCSWRAPGTPVARENEEQNPRLLFQKVAHGSFVSRILREKPGIFILSLSLSLSPPPPISLLTLSLLAYLSIIYWNTFPLIYLLCLSPPLLHSLVHLSPRR